MDEKNKRKNISQFIRSICKNRNEAELCEAEENFKEYLQILMDMSVRLEIEGNESQPLRINKNVVE